MIEKTLKFETVEEAVADLDFVYATTARQRDMLKTVRHPVEAAQILRSTVNKGGKVGILFGRERWGLNNDEVALANENSDFACRSGFFVPQYRAGRFDYLL